MIRYAKYRPSNSIFLGEIPEHWEVKRVKDIFNSLDHKRIPLSGSEREKMEKQIYDYYGASGVIDKVQDYIFNDRLILIGEDGANLINRSKPLAFIAEGKFWVNNHAHILKPKKGFSIDYYVHALEALDYSIWISGSAQPKLNQEKLNNVEVCVPLTKEQEAIAEFISKKVKVIETKIALLERKSTYYKELSKSLINETVCKGLNKNVVLKASGIEWIGEIPKHWQIKRLKDVGYLYSGLSGKTGEHFNQEVSDNSQHYIPFTNIANNKYINHEDLHTVLMGENERQNKAKKNDLFFLMSSEGFADIGKSALLIEDVKDTYLNSFCKGYRITKKTVVPKYLNYLLNSPAFRDKFIVQGKGFTRINLKMEKVSDFEFIIPPVEEQTAIAEHLDKKTTTIDAIVANIKLQIDSLKELRKTLINDVVTGKLKVTEDEKR